MNLPELVVSPPSLTIRVVQGTARSLDFNVTNVGSIEAHMVRAVLPNVKFLSLVHFGTAQQQNEGELTLDSGECHTDCPSFHPTSWRDFWANCGVFHGNIPNHSLQDTCVFQCAHELDCGGGG